MMKFVYTLQMKIIILGKLDLGYYAFAIRKQNYDNIFRGYYRCVFFLLLFFFCDRDKKKVCADRIFQMLLVLSMPCKKKKKK